MLAFCHLLAMAIINPFRSRRRVEIENLFLRHQLNIALVAVSRFHYWMAADEVFGTHSHWATPPIQADVMSTYSRLRLLSDISNKK
jgi:hypothetical protein